jgi:hypothetical protein
MRAEIFCLLTVTSFYSIIDCLFTIIDRLLTSRCAFRGLMPTLGAYCLLAYCGAWFAPRSFFQEKPLRRFR